MRVRSRCKKRNDSAMIHELFCCGSVMSTRGVSQKSMRINQLRETDIRLNLFLPVLFLNWASNLLVAHRDEAFKSDVLKLRLKVWDDFLRGSVVRFPPDVSGIIPPDRLANGLCCQMRSLSKGTCVIWPGEARCLEISTFPKNLKSLANFMR